MSAGEVEDGEGASVQGKERAREFCSVDVSGARFRNLGRLRSLIDNDVIPPFSAQCERYMAAYNISLIKPA